MHTVSRVVSEFMFSIIGFQNRYYKTISSSVLISVFYCKDSINSDLTHFVFGLSGLGERGKKWQPRRLIDWWSQRKNIKNVIVNAPAYIITELLIIKKREKINTRSFCGDRTEKKVKKLEKQKNTWKRYLCVNIITRTTFSQRDIQFVTERMYKCILIM